MKKILKHLRKNWIRHGFETLAVLLGVLAAFSLNNWQQNVRNLKLEKEYLSRFVLDLERDSIDISQVNDRATVNVKLCIVLLDKLESEIELTLRKNPGFEYANTNVSANDSNYSFGALKIILNNIGDILTEVSSRRSFDVATSTFTDLTSTGKIDLVRNKKLRSDIQQYYGAMVGSLDFEDTNIKPALDYFKRLLPDLGIAPYSSISQERFKSLAHEDQRLTSAIKYLLLANLKHMWYSKDRSSDIQNMSIKIKNELRKL